MYEFFSTCKSSKFMNSSCKVICNVCCCGNEYGWEMCNTVYDYLMCRCVILGFVSALKMFLKLQVSLVDHQEALS